MSLIQEVQQRLNIGATVFNNMNKHSHMLQLVVLNYRPIWKWVEGKKCYLYVDAFTKEGKVYFLEKRTLKHTSTGKVTPEPVGNLDDIIRAQASRYDTIAELAVMSGNERIKGDLNYTTKDSTIIYTTSDEEEVIYSRKNTELQAILFNTGSFAAFERSAVMKDNRHTMQNVIIGSRMTAKDRILSRVDWCTVMYNTYMLYRNIELSDYYYCNLKKPNSESYFEMNRIFTMDEFIPLGYKFKDIFNPILSSPAVDDGNVCVWDAIATKYRPTNSAVTISPLSLVGGNCFSNSRESEQTFAKYTTRLLMSSMFNLSVAKMPTTTLKSLDELPIANTRQFVDFYSPKLFLTHFYYALIKEAELQDFFCLIGLNEEVILLYTDITPELEEKRVYSGYKAIEIYKIVLQTDYWRKFNSSTISSKNVTYGEALAMEYANYVFKIVNADTSYGRAIQTLDLSLHKE